MNKKYIVTSWRESFDIDGLINYFEVNGIYNDEDTAIKNVNVVINSFIEKELSLKDDWLPIEYNTRNSFCSPNEFNKIKFKKSVSRRDKSGYDSEYLFVEIIEIPEEIKIDEKIFNPEKCGWEIHRFFKESEKENKERDNLLFNVKRNVVKPTQCQLWNKNHLNKNDLDYKNFEVIHTFTEDSHFSRRLLKCLECGQLYIKEFYEEIDWIDGEDPQYVTFIPVRNKEEAEIISKVDLFEFQCFSPRINSDWPKGGEIKTGWIGR